MKTDFTETEGTKIKALSITVHMVKKLEITHGASLIIK